MKTITKEFKVYSYDELSEDSKDKVIADIIENYLNIDYEMLSYKMKKAIDKAETNRTPWFVGSYIWEDCQEEIESEAKEYQYLENGELFIK